MRRDDSGAATEFGFDWGPISVERAVYDAKLGRVLIVRVPSEHHRVEIAVSPKGRSVRVWLDGQRMSVDDA